MSRNETRKKTIIALKKAIGSIQKTLTLIENESYNQCSDVLVHIDSSIGSLQSARTKILETYLDECIHELVEQTRTHATGKSLNQLKSQLSQLYKLSK